MSSFTTKEADRGFIDYTLTYDKKFWSNAAKLGLPIPNIDVEKVYFYVKTNLDDASAIIELTDADSTQIEWLDDDAGKIRVKLGIRTEGHVGEHYYELRLKFADGSWLTFDSGTLVVEESIVDTPA